MFHLREREALEVWAGARSRCHHTFAGGLTCGAGLSSVRRTHGPTLVPGYRGEVRQASRGVGEIVRPECPPDNSITPGMILSGTALLLVVRRYWPWITIHTERLLGLRPWRVREEG
jgi:hypothetical protein